MVKRLKCECTDIQTFGELEGNGRKLWWKMLEETFGRFDEARIDLARFTEDVRYLAKINLISQEDADMVISCVEAVLSGKCFRKIYDIMDKYLRDI